MVKNIPWSNIISPLLFCWIVSLAAFPGCNASVTLSPLMWRNEGPTVFDNSDFAIGKKNFPKESKTRQTVFFRLSLKSKFLTKEKKEKREKQSEKKV